LGTISKAIRNITPEKIEHFRGKKEAYEQAITDRVHRGLFVLDTDFHAAVIEMMDNAILADRYRDLCKRIFLRFRVEALRVERIHQIVEEHNRLFEAICIKDVALAKELLRNHNRNARKNLFSLIFDDSQKDKKIQ
jgi:DNA-binding GntR family transcriptional regulator